MPGAQITQQGICSMLLSSAPIGEVKQIKAIWLEDDIKHILEDLGIAIDSEIRVVLKACDNAFIVCVKEKRIAIGEELARKIIV